jgi:hypothetical protein
MVRFSYAHIPAYPIDESIKLEDDLVAVGVDKRRGMS